MNNFFLNIWLKRYADTDNKTGSWPWVHPVDLVGTPSHHYSRSVQVVFPPCFSLKRQMVPSDRASQTLRQTQLHTSDGKGVCIVSQLAHTTSRLSPSAFEGTYLKGTLVMDGRRYHNNNSSWKGGNLLENSLFSYCPGRPKKTSQPVQSHETSDPSEAL